MTAFPSPSFTPVAGAERLQALDVLRGFALIGICVANVEFFNRSVVETGQGIPAGLNGLDWLAAWLVNYLVSTKFWTIFSLLFGMGFAIMQERAKAAGRPFLPAYLRRIGVLLAFGLLHHCLLWNGDILISYAFGAAMLVLTLFAGRGMLLAAAIVLSALAQLPSLSFAAWPIAMLLPAALLSLYLRPGSGTVLLQLLTFVPGSLLLLIAFGNRDDLPLLAPVGLILLVLGGLVRFFPGPLAARPWRAGVTLILLIYGLVVMEGAMRHFLPVAPATATASIAQTGSADPQANAPDQDDDDGAAYRRDLARSAEETTIFSKGSYAQAVAMRIGQLGTRLKDECAGAILLLGLFLTGIGLERSGIVAQPAAHRTVLRRTALVGIPVGLGLGLLGALISTGRPLGVDDQGHDAAAGLILLGSLPSALGYMAAILLMLHSHGAWARVRLLSPFGQMALSNYLSQSIVMTLLFYGYGLGLWGIGRAAQVGIALALCALQIGFSHWWLARFRYGPVEWLWRALTYLALPALRKAR